MAATAERIKHYEQVHGIKEVEAFLDAILSIQEHIDPSLVRPKLLWSVDDEEEEMEEGATPYDDLWSLDEKKPKKQVKKSKKPFPPSGKRYSAFY
ncbi:stage V sporulation protein R, SpoVR [Bacillus tequilensis]|nr:stage V sporulation protein R, SpoVR [Bacillus tequilensis]